MKKTALFCLYTLGWLLGLLGIFMAALGLTMRDRGYFARGYAAMDIEAQIGISAADCTDALMGMIGYMTGRADTFQLTVTEWGTPVEMFNQQELDHMVDVRALYAGFRRAALAGWAAMAALTAAAVISHRRGGEAALRIRRAWWAALLLLGVLVLGLGAYALLDFNSFWTAFHLIFFTNDLWLMDYATCRMIRICPLELFSGIIARFTAIALGALGVISLGVLRLQKRRAK